MKEVQPDMYGIMKCDLNFFFALFAILFRFYREKNSTVEPSTVCVISKIQWELCTFDYELKRNKSISLLFPGYSSEIVYHFGSHAFGILLKSHNGKIFYGVQKECSRCAFLHLSSCTACVCVYVRQFTRDSLKFMALNAHAMHYKQAFVYVITIK